MKNCYVLKLYSEGVKPLVVEVFPNTEEGRKDAETFAEIMTRNTGRQHIVVVKA